MNKLIFLLLCVFACTLANSQKSEAIIQFVDHINEMIDKIENCEIQSSNPFVSPHRYGNIFLNSLSHLIYDFFMTDRPFIGSFRISIGMAISNWMGFKPR